MFITAEIEPFAVAKTLQDISSRKNIALHFQFLYKHKAKV